MAVIEQLTTVDQWEHLQKNPGLSLVFKHSTSCPISAEAHRQFTRWAASAPDTTVKIYLVHVIEDRPLSRQIATDTGVTHQSPQALLLREGRVLWYASHWAITADSLAESIAHPETATSHSTSLLQAQVEHRAQLAQTKQ